MAALSAVPDPPSEVAWSTADTERLRRLVADGDSRQWEIGDFLLERLPMGRVGANDGSRERIREEANKIGAAPATLHKYRAVSYSWPERMRIPSASHAVHQIYSGPPEAAADRARTLESLRNEHGVITPTAVRDMTKAATGKPGWLEMIGRVGDDLIAAEKALSKFEAEVGEKPTTQKIRDRAAQYVQRADDLAVRLNAIATHGGP